MTGPDALYDVHERTGNPVHTSVNDVIAHVFERAQNQREDHQDAHFNEAMATVVDRCGADAVCTVIHRVLVEHYPFRTATVDLDMRNIDDVRTGTTAGWYLEELNAE
ncbi:hypothetical protein ACFQE1_00260 [Halobium palmae]|uniref:DUF8158 domain-containing protein n=1 Tax=Halobium palmae TaxID=1776492 RepID=A0ABD5RUB8_9EURY